MQMSLASDQNLHTGKRPDWLQVAGAVADLRLGNLKAAATRRKRAYRDQRQGAIAARLALGRRWSRQ